MLKVLNMINHSSRMATLVPETVLQHAKISALFRLSSCHRPRVRLQSASTQANLPHLPVPPLQKTLDTYLRSLKPLITDQEFTVTQRIVKDFGAADGIGTKLQKLLEEKAETSENWLAEWWLNNAYLDFRSPLIVHSSPGLVFPLQIINTQEEQIALAAKVILAALDFKKCVDDGKIPPEKMGKDPLDMSQYSKVLGTCRIPGITRDSLSFESCDVRSRHVTVVHNNHFFELAVYGDSCQPLSEDQIKCELQEIIKCSTTLAVPVGVLTSENRNIWGKAYKALSSDQQNSNSLSSIQKSLFLVCLDKANENLSIPNKRTGVALQMVHGCGSKNNGGNRWHDKTIQFIIGCNGELGLTYEHSPAEGPPIAYLMDHIMNIIDNGGVSHPPAKNYQPPKHLMFNVSSGICEVIKNAECSLDTLVNDLDMYFFTYKGYGKEFPKSQKLSPDSFIQMALQFAFYRIHNEPGAHYESASTRKYIHGRTETIRSCSIESVAFARAMLDRCTTNEEKVDALRAAVNSHKDYTIMAVNGFGVDRHLMGLKLTAIENGMDIPKLFEDKGYIHSSHMRISSSQVAARCDSFMCYGPLVPNGYACCYNPRPKDIKMAVSAFSGCPETSARKFKEALEESFDDMRNVLIKTQKSKL